LYQTQEHIPHGQLGLTAQIMLKKRGTLLKEENWLKKPDVLFFLLIFPLEFASRMPRLKFLSLVIDLRPAFSCGDVSCSKSL